MMIVLDMEEVQRLLKGKEYSRVLPIGTVRTHDFQYKEAKLAFLLDYPMNKNVRCVLDNFTVQDDDLVCTCGVDSILTKTLIKFLEMFLSPQEKVFQLRFPELRFNLSGLKLPFTPRAIECLPEEVRITGMYHSS